MRFTTLLFGIPAAVADLRLVVTAGRYPAEVSWTLTCVAPEPRLLSASLVAVEGGAPYDRVHDELRYGSRCTLAMRDVFGDGWNGATFRVFDHELTLADGLAAGTHTFTLAPKPVVLQAPSTAAVAPPLYVPPTSPASGRHAPRRRRARQL